MLKLILSIIITCSFFTAKAQPDIKINNTKINNLDRHRRKQGDWLFFDKSGNIRLRCVFKNDSCVSPLIFYENSDTVFIKLPVKDAVESFVLYKNKKKYFGDFIHTSDTTSVIEIDAEPSLNDNIISEIKNINGSK